jgi:DNA-directed RNA polymerase omega subunit
MAHSPEIPEPDSADAGEGPSSVPITSRFLFVDVAAQRAKQLRRGARARLDRHAGSHIPHKLERIAMEEVRTGLVEYQLPKHIPPPEKA